MDLIVQEKPEGKTAALRVEACASDAGALMVLDAEVCPAGFCLTTGLS